MLPPSSKHLKIEEGNCQKTTHSSVAQNYLPHVTSTASRRHSGKEESNSQCRTLSEQQKPQQIGGHRHEHILADKTNGRSDRLHQNIFNARQIDGGSETYIQNCNKCNHRYGKEGVNQAPVSKHSHWQTIRHLSLVLFVLHLHNDFGFSCVRKSFFDLKIFRTIDAKNYFRSLSKKFSKHQVFTAIFLES